MGVFANVCARIAREVERLRLAFTAGKVSGEVLERATVALGQVYATGGKSYDKWRNVVKRRGAPSSGSRQNERREWFRAAFKEITERYPGESRARRRRMAGGLGKRCWADVIKPKTTANAWRANGRHNVCRAVMDAVRTVIEDGQAAAAAR
jgi:hypothetical protein